MRWQFFLWFVPHDPGERRENGKHHGKDSKTYLKVLFSLNGPLAVEHLCLLVTGGEPVNSG